METALEVSELFLRVLNKTSKAAVKISGFLVKQVDPTMLFFLEQKRTVWRLKGIPRTTVWTYRNDILVHPSKGIQALDMDMLQGLFWYILGVPTPPFLVQFCYYFGGSVC